MALVSCWKTCCTVALSTEFPENYNFLESRVLVMCEETVIKWKHWSNYVCLGIFALFCHENLKAQPSVVRVPSHCQNWIHLDEARHPCFCIVSLVSIFVCERLSYQGTVFKHISHPEQCAQSWSWSALGHCLPAGFTANLPRRMLHLLPGGLHRGAVVPLFLPLSRKLQSCFKMGG